MRGGPPSLFCLFRSVVSVRTSHSAHPVYDAVFHVARTLAPTAEAVALVTPTGYDCDFCEYHLPRWHCCILRTGVPVTSRGGSRSTIASVAHVEE